MRKSILAIAGVVFLASPFGAAAAPASCAQVQAVIKSSGSVLVHYAPGTAQRPPLYDRFVSSSNRCPVAYTRVKVKTIMTGDGRICPLKVCATKDD